MNYSETMKYITSTDWKGSSLGLDRMATIMKGLHNPQDKIHTIHVAGTNGKGSCCAMLSSVLKQAGYKVGMYTSPHLIDYEERFIIDGKQITKNDFCKVAAKVKKVTDKMSNQPTEFEILTSMCYEYFYEQKVDVAIMEVGLGGRLDATNVISKPDLSIIMNIGLEHTEILGDTLAKIAYEKAGIIKDGCDVVAYNNCKEITDVFKSVSKQRNAKLTLNDPKKIKILAEGLDKQEFNYKNYNNLQLSLLGKHQFNNASVVIEAVEVLKKKGYKINKKSIRNGLRNTNWDARLSVLNDKPLFILDGAHNPQCAEALQASLPKILKRKKAIILCGMLADKDYRLVMDMMIPFAKEFVCLTPFSNRALPAKDLAKVLRKKGQIATPCETVEEGIRLALDKAGEDGIIVAFGSLYLAGYVEEKFNGVYTSWLRDTKKQARSNISKANHSKYSKIINNKLINTKQFKNAKNILIYNPINNEVALDEISKVDKNYAYPLCTDDKNMIALIPNDNDSFKTGKFNIKEPIKDKSKSIKANKLDMLICPLTVFDEKLNRMGMGKGYYDRYLEKVSKDCVIVGLAFENQKTNHVPVNSHDKKMDMIITEKKIYK